MFQKNNEFVLFGIDLNYCEVFNSNSSEQWRLCFSSICWIAILYCDDSEHVTLSTGHHLNVFVIVVCAFFFSFIVLLLPITIYDLEFRLWPSNEFNSQHLCCLTIAFEWRITSRIGDYMIFSSYSKQSIQWSYRDRYLVFTWGRMWVAYELFNIQYNWIWFCIFFAGFCCFFCFDVFVFLSQTRILMTYCPS